MDLRAMRYFLTVSRTLNMTAAAKELFVSQSALSRQITELERELNTTLFRRESRGLRLTEAGIHLARRAEEILSLTERTERELREGETLYGDIRIGAPETRAMALLAQAIRQVQQSHPLIRFHIRTGPAKWVMEQMELGLHDFGLMFTPVNLDRLAYLRVPFSERMGLLLRRDHPLAGAAAVTPEELRHLPLLVSARHLDNIFLRTWGGLTAGELNIVESYNLIYNAGVLVDAGVGCALTTESLAQGQVPLGRVFVPLSPAAELRLIFAWRKDRSLTGTEEFFLRELKTILKEEAEHVRTQPESGPRGESPVI